jgi:metal-responsive CopG/Arc/MetJ family transcriptional regulator
MESNMISPKNTILTIAVPKQLRAEVDNLTAKTGASMSEITRRALAAYLKAQATTPAQHIAIGCTEEA